MNNSTLCRIPIQNLEEYLKNTFSVTNDSTPFIVENKRLTNDNSMINEDIVNLSITEEDVKKAFKGISKDTASGPDKIS